METSSTELFIISVQGKDRWHFIFLWAFIKGNEQLKVPGLELGGK